MITLKDRAYVSVQSLKQQQGVATLLVSVIILLLITITVLYTSKTVFLEQKITSNDLRSKIAFENAESGIAAAIRAIKDKVIAVDASDVNPLDGQDYFVVDTDDDGIADANTIAYENGSVTISLVLTDPDTVTYALTSTATSDDGSATRTISRTVESLDPIPNEPDNPMITRGGVVIAGSATVHNPEGNSTIWSGGNVDLGTNNSTTTLVPDPAGANYPLCQGTPMLCCGSTTANVNDCAGALAETSNKDTIGLDVVENDVNLASLTDDEFFENFFGLSAALYQSVFEDQIIMVDPANISNLASDASPGIDLSAGDILWITGDANFNGGTVGCAVSVSGGANVCADANRVPSIVIVDGNLTISGNTHFYGLVFVAGNMNLSGSVNIFGSIVVGGITANSGGGSLDVVFRSDVFGGVGTSPPATGNTGSWRDF